MSQDHGPLFCNRCLRELTPGEGDFYLILISAVADPSPPVVNEQDLQRDFRSEIRALIAQMEKMSSQELMDQVHRQFSIHLCTPCYNQWIENPTP